MKGIRLLRCKEAGDLLGLKSAYVRALEKRGVLMAVRDPGGHRRFRLDAVLKFKHEHLEAQRT